MSKFEIGMSKREIVEAVVKGGSEMRERMTVEEAEELVGKSLHEYVFAQTSVDREATHREFSDLRYAFRKTYGTEQWKTSLERIVKERVLEDYIFDVEALRDG